MIFARDRLRLFTIVSVPKIDFMTKPMMTVIAEELTITVFVMLIFIERLTIYFQEITFAASIWPILTFFLFANCTVGTSICLLQINVFPFYVSN